MPRHKIHRKLFSTHELLLLLMLLLLLLRERGNNTEKKGGKYGRSSWGWPIIADAVTWRSLESYFIGQKILQYTQLVSPLCTRSGLYGRRTKETPLRFMLPTAHIEKGKRNSSEKKRDMTKKTCCQYCSQAQLSTMIPTPPSLVNQLVITVDYRYLTSARE